MSKYYTGIGSRQTPVDVLTHMTNLSKFLEKFNYVLRSGGASGADSAFEKGVNYTKEIYLPWKGFNGNDSLKYNLSDESYNIAKNFHPNWSSLSPGAKKLHARNVYQVLGKNLDNPSDFVICWTPDGKDSGGTGQALRIAKHYNVKIYNLFKKEDKDDLVHLIKNVILVNSWF